MSLGTAFENLSRGPGMAYFPAISLSFKESVAFNFGSRPLRYPFRRGRGAAWDVGALGRAGRACCLGSEWGAARRGGGGGSSPVASLLGVPCRRHSTR